MKISLNGFAQQPDEIVERILRAYDTITVVGASKMPGKPALGEAGPRRTPSLSGVAPGAV